MPKTDTITQARLKELLHYDPETGDFVWIKKPSPKANRIKVGDIAGTDDGYGYIVIKIDGVSYRAHRLAFLYILGWMPEQVDHDNQVRDDNRWINLNAATNAINSKNQKLRCTNTSGYCGVYPEGERWRAQTKVNGKKIHLGYFTDKADAIAARKAADIKYGFHVNHGLK